MDEHDVSVWRQGEGGSDFGLNGSVRQWYSSKIREERFYLAGSVPKAKCFEMIYERSVRRAFADEYETDNHVRA